NGSSANVTITNATNNPVLLDMSPTIGNLNVGASNTLNMPGQALYITGSTLDNSGQINVGFDQSGSNVYVDGPANVPLTLQGSGTFTLNDPYSNLSGYASNSLWNQSTINGQGTIFRLDMTNFATVNANVAGATLSISESTVSNFGTVKATGGGTL